MRDTSDAFWENWHPFGLAILHLIVVSLITFFTDYRITNSLFDESKLWSPFFTLAAGAGGILFSVFVFMMAPAAGFVEKISKLAIFEKFKGFVKNALFFTALGVASTLPLIMADESQYDQLWYVWNAIIASSVLVAMTLSIIRVLRIFMIWASAD
tara:strand:- start:1157 stop:1621 length:465 start_codon:yes stop_codon:yes gene_type:complete